MQSDTILIAITFFVLGCIIGIIMTQSHTREECDNILVECIKNGGDNCIEQYNKYKTGDYYGRRCII